MAEILVYINEVKICALLDLGATKSVINYDLVKRMKMNVINSNTILKCANGNSLSTVGEVEFSVKLTDQYTKTINAIVSDALSHKFILGTDFIDTLSYDKQDRFVIVNDVKMRRFMPKDSPILIRCPKTLKLKGWQHDAKINVTNPLHFSIDNESILIERPNNDITRYHKFSICETINNNSESFDIFISNMSDCDIEIPKGTVIAQISPADTDKNQVMSLTQCADIDSEKEALANFQSKRESRYKLSGKIPDIDLSNLKFNQQKELEQILIDNSLAFAGNENDLGRIAYWRFSVPFVNENVECYQAPRPIPPGLSEKVKSEFQKWQDNDLVEEAYSPVNIPVLIVRKQNGSVRLALDARKLNQISVKDRFPMPNMADIFHRIGLILSDATEPFISSFDAKRAYNQLMLDESDRNKVAFSIFNKHYRAKRLVYGLQNGPSAFSRLMSKLFSDDNEIFVFIDDILIISKSWAEHSAAIDRLLKKCISVGLVLDPTKSQIAKSECTFLGETITKFGRRPSQKHVEAISKYPVPKNRKELKRFTGLCVFEQKFIKNASVIMKPLHKLSSNKVDFIWTNEHQDAFDSIKEALVKSVGINHRDSKKELILTTDASLEAAGGILSQLNSQGDYEPLGYFSRTFTESERRQSARHREAYAIHDAIKHFEFLLLGEKFTVETDHHSLVWLAKEHLSQTLNMRMVNVYHYLSGFDFVIKYRPNTTPQIKAADALSRAIIARGMIGCEKLVKKTNPTDTLFGIEHFTQPVEHVNIITRAKNYESELPRQEQKCDEKHTNDNICFRFADKSFRRDEMHKLQRNDPYIKSILTKLDCKCKIKRARKQEKGNFRHGKIADNVKNLDFSKLKMKFYIILKWIKNVWYYPMS